MLMMCWFFFRANETKADSIMDILKKYSQIVGQSPSLSKSGLFFSNNAKSNLTTKIRDNMGIQRSDDNINYLDNPLF